MLLFKIMQVVDIANEIFLENASPTDTSITAIAFWIRSNVGKLNTLLYEDFYVDPTTKEIFRCGTTCTINILAAAVVKAMYKVYRSDLDIRNLIAGLGSDLVQSAKDMDFEVVRVNRSEILKTYNLIKAAATKELQDLVHYYRSYNGPPSQVAGDDTYEGYYTGALNEYIRGYLGS